MVEIANAFGVATVLTAIFALRYRYWSRPGVLAAYFALFFTLEWSAGHFFIPHGAMGVEIAAVCLALTLPILAAIVALRKYEQRVGSAQ